MHAAPTNFFPTPAGLCRKMLSGGVHVDMRGKLQGVFSELGSTAQKREDPHSLHAVATTVASAFCLSILDCLLAGVLKGGITSPPQNR